MTYHPGGMQKLGYDCPNDPHVVCNRCGVIKLALTSTGGPPSWLLKRKPPRGWSLDRVETPDGRIVRTDLCPGCRT